MKWAKNCSKKSDIKEKEKKKDYFVSKLNMIFAVYSIISTIKTY